MKKSGSGPGWLAVGCGWVLGLALAAGGCGDAPEPKESGRKKEARADGAKKPDAEAAKPAEKKVDPVEKKYRRLVRRAKKGDYYQLVALARFCRKHERYAAEAKRAYERVLEDDPEDEEALDYMGLALVEDLPMPKAAHEKLVESAWFEAASKVVEAEVKNEQRLRDVGLSYAYVPPFVIVKERLDDEEKDRRERKKLMVLLEGLYPAFLGLVGDTKALPEDPTAVVPLFWHRTRRAARTFERSRQPRLEETGERNPYWCVFDETRDEEAHFEARIEPLVRSLTASMVAAVLVAPTVPPWLETGIAGHVSRVRIDQRDGRPIVECGIADRATLKGVLANERRWTVERIVKRSEEENKALKDILEQLKKRGIDVKNISFNFGRPAPPDESWAFVAYLLEREPVKFRKLLERTVAGDDDQVVVKEVFGEDLAALDGAWMAWVEEKAAE